MLWWHLMQNPRFSTSCQKLPTLMAVFCIFSKKIHIALMSFFGQNCQKSFKGISLWNGDEKFVTEFTSTEGSSIEHSNSISHCVRRLQQVVPYGPCWSSESYPCVKNLGPFTIMLPQPKLGAFSWNMCPQWGMCQEQSSSLHKQIEHTSMINEVFQKYKIKFLNFLNFHSKKPRVKRKNVKAFTGLKQNAHQQSTWWRTQKCCGNL